MNNATGTAQTAAVYCNWCGAYHIGACWRVKSIEYNPDGTVKRVEFHDPRSGRARGAVMDNDGQLEDAAMRAVDRLASIPPDKVDVPMLMVMRGLLQVTLGRAMQVQNKVAAE